MAGLPKAELHVHHVGSASPRIVSSLAERHPGTVPSDPDALKEFFEAGLKALARAAVHASFAPEHVRAALLAEIDAYDGA